MKSPSLLICPAVLAGTLAAVSTPAQAERLVYKLKNTDGIPYRGIDYADGFLYATLGNRVLQLDLDGKVVGERAALTGEGAGSGLVLGALAVRDDGAIDVECSDLRRAGEPPRFRRVHGDGRVEIVSGTVGDDLASTVAGALGRQAGHLAKVLRIKDQPVRQRVLGTDHRVYALAGSRVWAFVKVNSIRWQATPVTGAPLGAGGALQAPHGIPAKDARFAFADPATDGHLASLPHGGLVLTDGAQGIWFIEPEREGPVGLAIQGLKNTRNKVRARFCHERLLQWVQDASEGKASPSTKVLAMHATLALEALETPAAPVADAESPQPASASGPVRSTETKAAVDTPSSGAPIPPESPFRIASAASPKAAASPAPATASPAFSRHSLGSVDGDSSFASEHFIGPRFSLEQEFLRAKEEAEDQRAALLEEQREAQRMAEIQEALDREREAHPERFRPRRDSLLDIELEEIVFIDDVEGSAAV